MQWRLAAMAMCLAAMPAGAMASTLGAYADLKVEAWSNGVPVLALEGDWSKGYEPRSGDQRAYEMARAEAGVRFNPGWDGLDAPWAIGLLARADGSARLSGPAAQVLALYQSRTDPAAPGQYDARSRILFWTGRGLSVHTPTLAWGGFKADLGWDHMTLHRLRSMQTQGLAAYNADGSYTYKLNVRDDSWHTTEPFIHPPASNGWGDAVSLGLSWRDGAPTGGAWAGVRPTWVSFKVDDAWSRLQWQGINGNDAVVNSQVANRTPDGRIDYQAAIRGQYTRRTLVERIPVTTQLGLGWARLEGDWSLQVQHRLGLWQHWVSWQSPGTVRWLVAAEPVAKALRLGVDWGGLSASVMTDKLDTAAHVRGGQLSWVSDF